MNTRLGPRGYRPVKPAGDLVMGDASEPGVRLAPTLPEFTGEVSPRQENLVLPPEAGTEAVRRYLFEFAGGHIEHFADLRRAWHAFRNAQRFSAWQIDRAPAREGGGDASQAPAARVRSLWISFGMALRAMDMSPWAWQRYRSLVVTMRARIASDTGAAYAAQGHGAIDAANRVFVIDRFTLGENGMVSIRVDFGDGFRSFSPPGAPGWKTDSVREVQGGPIYFVPSPFRYFTALMPLVRDVNASYGSPGPSGLEGLMREIFYDVCRKNARTLWALGLFDRGEPVSPARPDIASVLRDGAQSDVDDAHYPHVLVGVLTPSGTIGRLTSSTMVQLVTGSRDAVIEANDRLWSEFHAGTGGDALGRTMHAFEALSVNDLTRETAPAWFAAQPAPQRSLLVADPFLEDCSGLPDDPGCRDVMLAPVAPGEDMPPSERTPIVEITTNATELTVPPGRVFGGQPPSAPPGAVRTGSVLLTGAPDAARAILDGTAELARAAPGLRLARVAEGEHVLVGMIGAAAVTRLTVRVVSGRETVIAWSSMPNSTAPAETALHRTSPTVTWGVVGLLGLIGLGVYAVREQR